MAFRLCSTILLMLLVSGGQAQSTGEPPSDPFVEPPCVEKLNSAVQFAELTVSKYMVWVAAVVLLAGVIQILVALFVFFADSLDIYMLLLNYCLAIIFCIVVVIVSGSGMITLTKSSCDILSPLSCVALSVPLYSLFLLSFSRFYAITWPFYYVDRFTLTNQIVICSLSWIIPTLVAFSSSMGLCHVDFLWEQFSQRGGFCGYRALHFDVSDVVTFTLDGRSTNRSGGLPPTTPCFAFLMLYVSTCLLLPLLGCIVCYVVICVKIIKARKNREQMTSSSAGPPVDEDEDEHEENPTHFSTLKNTFKSQSARIKKAAANTIPVSVMVILSMYILVAVPLSLVFIFNNKLYAGNDRTFFLNISPEAKAHINQLEKDGDWCEDIIETEFTPIAIVIDCLYSLGLLSLALSPWAYIQSTKSFHDKLWSKPIRKVSKWGSKKVRQSVRARQNRPAAARGHRAPPRAAPPGTTGGYTTVQQSSIVTATVTTGISSTTRPSITSVGPVNGESALVVEESVVNGESALVVEESVVNGESTCLMAEEV